MALAKAFEVIIKEPSIMVKRGNNHSGPFKQRRTLPMTTKVKIVLVVSCVVILSIPSFAQTLGSRPSNSTPQTQGQSPNIPPTNDSIDTIASEIGLLRKSLQTLNARLREI